MILLPVQGRQFQSSVPISFIKKRKECHSNRTNGFGCCFGAHPTVLARTREEKLVRKYMVVVKHLHLPAKKRQQRHGKLSNEVRTEEERGQQKDCEKVKLPYFPRGLRNVKRFTEATG